MLVTRRRRPLHLAILGFVLVLGAASAIGWLLDSTDDRDGLARFDDSLTRWGAEHVTSGWRAVFIVATQFGSFVVIAPVFAVIAVVELRHRERRWVVWYLLIVGAGVALLNNGLKLTVDRERPAVAPLVEAAGSSFPSGHAAAAAACWAAITVVVAVRAGRRLHRLVAGSIVIAVVVAASRVLLGVHWLTDVVAGLVVGWAWYAVVTLALGGRLEPLTPPPADAVPAGAEAA
ncbi:MAG: phosphatase PAP2 family protein [Acidimicrobiia bacterium]|nr:phosphatase PAP2 family protein [Acidimicrobiia bacterium]